MIEKYRQPAQQAMAVKQMGQSPAIQKRFEEVLGKKAPAFIASIIGAVNANKRLQECDPVSIFGTGMIAATLDLSVVPTLGQAAMVPYRVNGRMECQFQVMTRGLVQLAQRTGLYKCINAGEVYEDEYDGEDMLTGSVQFHRVAGGYRDAGDTSKIVGYFAYIETTTGFSKTEYWTKQDVENHGKRYSKSFGSGPWKDNFDAMARKTVLKSLLNHYGPMSVDSQIAQAIAKDQMVSVEGQEMYEDSILGSVIMEGSPENQIDPEKAQVLEEELPATKQEAPQEAAEDEDGMMDMLQSAWDSAESL